MQYKSCKNIYGIHFIPSRYDEETRTASYIFFCIITPCSEQLPPSPPSEHNLLTTLSDT